MVIFLFLAAAIGFLIFGNKPLFDSYSLGAQPIVYNQLYSDNRPTSQEKEN